MRAALALVAALAVACSSGPGAPGPSGASDAPGRVSPGGVTPGASPAEEGSPGPASGVDACSLLSPEEVGAAVGGGVGPGEPTPSACAWRGDPGLPVVGLATAPIGGPGVCSTAAPPGAEPVDGLGFPAWWEAIQAEVHVGTLLVCPGGLQLILTLSGGAAGERVRRDAALELASSALARLF